MNATNLDLADEKAKYARVADAFRGEGRPVVATHEHVAYEVVV